ncbi:TPA: AAA family ATPase [Pseudomonas aeruginosa]
MDFYIRKVLINGLFEPGNNYKIDLHEGCNCIYGSNGTGKTTIINLIVNSLSVEFEPLIRTPFTSISIFLAKTGQVRANKFLTLTKEKSSLFPGAPDIRYEIEGDVSHIFSFDPRFSLSRVQDRYNEELDSLKQHISKKINLTHVPLLRMHDSELLGGRDERDEYLHSALRNKHLSSSQINEIIDPSVRVLNTLQRQFTAEANETRKTITEKLEVLKSKIIERVMIDESLVRMSAKALSKATKAISSELEDVDVSAYVSKLREARINVPEKKIHEHFSTWKKLNDGVRDAYKILEKTRKSKKENDPDSIKKHQDAVNKFNDSYFGLIAMTNFNDRFLSIVEDVESMQVEKLELTKSFSDYEKEINKYLAPRKSFTINEDGKFIIETNRKVELYDLSSGEKHILTILGKAALSRREGAIFVADEPELSLHLDWQRMILPSIIKLSPKSQIIVATHSPAITAKGATEIDLEECRDA